MKNSTVSSGKSRSKISSVGVGHPRNRRRRAIVKSIASPASTPAQNPQVSVFSQSLRFDESHDELDMSLKPAGQFTWNSSFVLGFVLERNPHSDQALPELHCAWPHSYCGREWCFFCAICSFGIDISQAIVTPLAR